MQKKPTMLDECMILMREDAPGTKQRSGDLNLACITQCVCVDVCFGG